MRRPDAKAQCHPFLRETIGAEIAAREWNEPAIVIAQLSKASLHNAERLLRFESRLTRIECWMLDTAFGVSAGFFSRLQDGFGSRYPGELKAKVLK